MYGPWQLCRAPAGKRSVKICGVQRVAVVTVFVSIGFLLLYYSAAHLTILWAALTGESVDALAVSLLMPLHWHCLALLQNCLVIIIHHWHFQLCFGSYAGAAHQGRARVLHILSSSSAVPSMPNICTSSAQQRARLGVKLSLYAGNMLVVVHAVLKTPNLKTRLASAREEFRAVW